MQELYTWNATAVHLECKSCTPRMQQLYTCNAIAVHLECKSCTPGMQQLYTWNARAVHNLTLSGMYMTYIIIFIHLDQNYCTQITFHLHDEYNMQNSRQLLDMYFIPGRQVGLELVLTFHMKKSNVLLHLLCYKADPVPSVPYRSFHIKQF